MTGAIDDTREARRTREQTIMINNIDAEVRVMELESRQLTVSIAEQLDIEPLHSAIQPIGRIRLHGEAFLIGRRKTDGALALARMPYDEWVDIYREGGREYHSIRGDRDAYRPDSPSHRQQAKALRLPLLILTNA